MKRISVVIGLFCLIGLNACHSRKVDPTLLSRDFLSTGWERFDYITKNVEIQQPTTYNLTMKASFDASYPFDYFSVAFTVFDTEDHPLRSKNYKFSLKDYEGVWKSELIDDLYTFTFPINSEMSLNEPGEYIFQLENRMPITPLVGIRHISIDSN